MILRLSLSLALVSFPSSFACTKLIALFHFFTFQFFSVVFSSFSLSHITLALCRILKNIDVSYFLCTSTFWRQDGKCIGAVLFLSAFCANGRVSLSLRPKRPLYISISCTPYISEMPSPLYYETNSSQYAYFHALMLLCTHTSAYPRLPAGRHPLCSSR